MSQDQAVSYEDTLDEPPLLDSTPQLESFPPLFITNADVYNSPSLKLSPSNHTVESKESGYRRWWILSLSCLLLFGNYFAYDNPAALNTQLQKYLGMPYNEYQYLLSTLYSIYSLPNTVLPFLFGSLVDKFGPQRVLLFLNGCVCIGQTLFSIGVQNRQVWLMLVGRAIFGIGGESCSVAQASITTMYFRGHELAFALGLNLCIARFGSVVNAIVTPWAEQLWGVPTAVWIGTLSCLASFISAVCLAMLIGDNEQVEMSKEKEDSYTTPLLSVTSGMNANESDSSLDLAINPTDHEDLDTLSASPQSSAQSPIIQHLPGIIQRQPSFAGSINSVRFSPGIPKSGTPPSLHIITDQSQNQDSWYHQWWDDIKYFPSTFWLICTLTILLYGTVVPFNNIASDFLQSKWYHNNPRKAAAVMGIPDTIGAILVPGFGYIVDKYGRRASTLIASAAIMVIVHSTLGFTMVNPIFSFSLLGIAYSMYGVALWPSIACVVTNELHLGKGYGISSSFLNISLTLVPPIVATIRVLGDSFLPVEIFFISMGLCGIIVGFALKYIDRRDGGALEIPEIQVEVPVIVSQTAGTISTPIIGSPSASMKQRNKQRQSILPQQLDVKQGSIYNSTWVPEWRQRRFRANTDQNYIWQFGKKQREEEPTATDSLSSSSHSSTTMSPASEKSGRRRSRWFSRPFPSQSKVRKPLLRGGLNDSRYGSISTPTISNMLSDDTNWDVEGGTKVASGIEGYSVSQHPILYNPLRGSSGSFRISRNAMPVSFGEGEEGCIYVDGQFVDPKSGDDTENVYRDESDQGNGTVQNSECMTDRGV